MDSLFYQPYFEMSGRFGELLLILLIVFVLFGAGKLPKVMSELGKGIRSFRKGINEKTQENEKEGDKTDV